MYLGIVTGAADYAFGSMRPTDLGQVTQEKTTSSVVYTVGYAYDLDGNITQITYPSGRTVTYSRGPTRLVTGVTTKATSTSSSVTLASGVSYQLPNSQIVPVRPLVLAPFHPQLG